MNARHIITCLLITLGLCANQSTACPKILAAGFLNTHLQVEQLGTLEFLLLTGGETPSESVELFFGRQKFPLQFHSESGGVRAWILPPSSGYADQASANWRGAFTATATSADGSVAHWPSLESGPSNLGIDELVVHEWGTFTTFQDEDGRDLGWINTDDEPLPNFVHHVFKALMVPPGNTATGLVHPFSYQTRGGVLDPRPNPGISLRLETPVVYFYPPARCNSGKQVTLDFKVEFKGGILSEYFPDANFRGWSGPDFLYDPQPPLVTPNIHTSLSWGRLLVGTEPHFPPTNNPVWLAPRRTSSAPVRATWSNYFYDTEKYLFYRGVANMGSPLRAVRTTEGTLHLSSAITDMNFAFNGANLRSSKLWLVDIRPDGALAWKELGSLDLTPGQRAILPATTEFAEIEYKPSNLAPLRRALHAGLLAEGLYDDEATAMLDTWEHVYFQTHGLRVFYMVPRAWVDAVLPITMSQPARLERGFIGRLELLTPAQRAIATQIAAGPAPDLDPLRLAAKACCQRNGIEINGWDVGDIGSVPLDELGVPIPELYQAYIDLGRFRNAILLEEQRLRPTADLDKFILDLRL